MRRNIGATDSVFGKIPPQAVDMEELVLGAVLMEKNAIEEIINDLPTAAFYRDGHQRIYDACKSLHASNEPIDIATVCHKLKSVGELELAGGPFAVSQLSNRIGSSANIKHHAKIIAQMFIKREVIRISSETIRQAFEDESDPFQLMDDMDKQIQECRESVLSGGGAMDWTDQLQQTVQSIEDLQKAELKVSGIPTGNYKLDSLTGGWQKSDLIIICARPGAGKTTRALNFIKTAGLYNYNSIMFSLEMGWRQVTKKFLSEQSNIYGNKLINGDVSLTDLDRLSDAKMKLLKIPFHLNDKGGITPNYIRSVIKQRKKKQGVDLVVIDYIQLMKPNDMVKGRTRDAEVGSISTAIKNIAKEFDIPIIMLAQLNRKCEDRNDKRPILSDLRESGSIENDADMVIGLYRPSYYYSFDKDRDYMEEINNGMTEDEYKLVSELHVLKHRNGATDRFIREKFIGSLSRFTSQEGVTSAPIAQNSLFTSPEKPFAEIGPNEELF